MRSFLIVVAVMLAPAVAFAQQGQPPSKTLERALKLYDKADYLSATIELKKVLDGETGDDAASTERAEFYQGKAIYQLGWYVPSLMIFQRIEADPAHTYRDATLKWVLAIARQLPERSGVLETIGLYLPDSSAIHELGDSRDEYAVLYGRYQIARNDFDAAVEILVTVPQGSPWWQAAQHQLGIAKFRTADTKGGVAAMTAAATDPLIAPLVVHDLAWWTRMLTDPSAARDALLALAEGDGPAAAAAKLAASRLAVEQDVDLAALRGVTDTFDALAIVVVCGRGAVDEALGRMQQIAGQLRPELGAIARYEDNAELFEVVRQRITMDDAEAYTLRLALGVADPLHWVAELRRELEVYDEADAAWRTTAVAADVLIELQLQKALAEADAGSWLRDRFEQIVVDLQRIGDAEARFGAGPQGDGLVVTAALCEAAGLPHVEAARPEPDPLPLPPPKKQARGCGCSTTGGAADLGAILLVLALAWRRRR